MNEIVKKEVVKRLYDSENLFLYERAKDNGDLEKVLLGITKDLNEKQTYSPEECCLCCSECLYEGDGIYECLVEHKCFHYTNVPDYRICNQLP